MSFKRYALFERTKKMKKKEHFMQQKQAKGRAILIFAMLSVLLFSYPCILADGNKAVKGKIVVTLQGTPK